MFLPMLNTEVKYYYTFATCAMVSKWKAGLAQPQLLDMIMNYWKYHVNSTPEVALFP